jgi:L-aspartate oxidase
MHGANRLASNSLLEAVVMSEFAADVAVEYRKNAEYPETPLIDEWLHSSIHHQKEKIIVAHDRLVIRKLMSDFLGIVRSEDRLMLAHDRIKLILKNINNYYLSQPASYAIIELRNIAQVAELIVRSAKRRKESRGLHYVVNYPETDDKHFKRNTIIKPPGYKSNRSMNGRRR